LDRYVINLIESDSKDYGVHHFSDKLIMTWYDFAKQILIENQMLDKIKLVKANKYLTFAKRPKNSILSKSE
jgi:dTDP-4-dehydrorhamnose reductase